LGEDAAPDAVGLVPPPAAPLAAAELEDFELGVEEDCAAAPPASGMLTLRPSASRRAHSGTKRELGCIPG
jgi:hypothetical protein